MTRKSVKFPSALRRSPWKTSVGKRESDDKNASKSIVISTARAERWSNLKVKFRFRSDSELVDYLLNLGESQPKPSLSPDHESDDGWCASNRNERRKRGPSLRAVLRRSSRKPSSKSDFGAECIDSEELQSQDSNQSEEDEVQRRKFANRHPQSVFVNEKHKGVSKRLNQTQTESKSCFRGEKKEAKAYQLDAELALLVESVDLQAPKQSENELYEFKDETLSGKNPTSSSAATDNSNNAARGGQRRWKSYHKDKRKWRQSYAAVRADEDQNLRMKPSDDGCDSYKSEKDKKIFKALKKNRILTAYLDSQNQIADTLMKDSNCSPGDEDQVSPREATFKPDLEPTNRLVMSIDTADDSSGGRTKEEIVDGAEDFTGKENQSKSKVSAETAFVEVGERVKLKKRKKKVLQDAEESASNFESVSDDNTADREKHHRKLKRNWKKSIINYELEEKESDLNSPDIASDSCTSAPNALSEDPSLFELNVPKTECNSETAQKNRLDSESFKDVPHSSGLESESSEQDGSLVQAQECTECHVRHAQRPCPVQQPHHIMEDSITFEQWQLQCQVQVRCSVIESPRPKSTRLKKNMPETPTSNEHEKNIWETSTKSDEHCRTYAEESLPPSLGLQVIDEKHGKSVLTKSSISQFTRFGPLVGPHVPEKDISDESDMRHIWEVLDGKNAVYVNTEDPQKSNWLRFVRPAPERQQRNVTVIVQNKELYFVSIADIPIGNELLFWADDHVTSWSKKKILKSSCGGCNMHFSHPLYYRTHCAIFHDPFHSLTIRKYHCKVCGESVMGKENIMKHAADLHEGRGAYQCQYCHKFFLRLNYLEMHRTYGCSSNPHRTRPLCDFCGRYFCQPQKLKVHIKRMHSDMNEVLREFQCKSCLKILGSRAALQRHFKEVHHRDVVVSSNCDRCGKSFQNRSNLKIHMLTHSGVKPFRCQQEGCSAAFTTKQCLQFHYKKAHGLSEDALPRIERSIAYTFDAYAGETTDSSSRDKEQVRRPQKVFRKSRKSSSKNQRNQGPGAHGKHPDDPSEPCASDPLKPQPLRTFQCSEPVQVNNSAEENLYNNGSDAVCVPDPIFSQKIVESATVHGKALSPSSVEPHLPYGDEDKQLGDKVLTPLRTVNLHHANESYHSHVTSVMPCPQSPCQSPPSHLHPSGSQDMRSVISLENKGHKKWLGEVIEVAEEAAAAAMGISPHLSPHLKRDIYDFDENKVKSKLQYLDNLGRQDLPADVVVGRSKTASALAPFHHPESASMLVEAALDAAERDICCPALAGKIPSSPTSRSPEPHSLTPYCMRSAQQGEQPNSSYYSPERVAAATNDHYLMGHSTSPISHLHPMNPYRIPPPPLSPSRMYVAPSHQVHQHQLLPQGPLSSDEEGGVDADCTSRGDHAENLSLNMKEKASERTNASSMYAAHPQHPELTNRSAAYQEHVPLPHQNDLNFSESMVVSSRYHLYDLSPDRQRSDVRTDLSITNRGMPQDFSAYEDVGGSVDLSVPRDHGTDSHTLPSDYNPSMTHQYNPQCVPNYHTHPTAYQSSPLQRPHISSSSDSPNTSSSPGPAHYHSYPTYY